MVQSVFHWKGHARYNYEKKIILAIKCYNYWAIWGERQVRFCEINGTVPFGANGSPDQ